jgi:hypothetical protein
MREQKELKSWFQIWATRTPHQRFQTLCSPLVWMRVLLQEVDEIHPTEQLTWEMEILASPVVNMDFKLMNSWETMRLRQMKK